MSSNNDDSAGVAGAVAAGVVVLSLTMFLVAAFITFVLTAIAIAAWNKPLRIGKLSVAPDEARSFVRRGIAGAFLLPAFCVFLDAFLGITINWDYLFHIMFAGYIVGSLGMEVLFANDTSGAVIDAEPTSPPSPSPANTRLPAPPPVAREPFRFATWDDEESGR